MSTFLNGVSSGLFFLPCAHVLLLPVFLPCGCDWQRTISGHQNVLSPCRTGWEGWDRSSASSFNTWQERTDAYVSSLALGWGSFEIRVAWELIAHGDWLIMNTLRCFYSLPPEMASQINWHSDPIYSPLLREPTRRQGSFNPGSHEDCQASES